MSETIKITDVAKLVRKELKANFPDHKFKVKSSRYAGGSSIYVDWVNGPSYTKVDKIVSPFHGAEFDGMIDLKTFNDKPYENDYILCNRRITQDVIDRLIEEKTAKFDPEASRFQIEDIVHREMQELDL